MYPGPDEYLPNSGGMGPVEQVQENQQWRKEGTRLVSKQPHECSVEELRVRSTYINPARSGQLALEMGGDLDLLLGLLSQKSVEAPHRFVAESVGEPRGSPGGGELLPYEADHVPDSVVKAVVVQHQWLSKLLGRLEGMVFAGPGENGFAWDGLFKAIDRLQCLLELCCEHKIPLGDNREEPESA